jgi:tripartite-type tricarboxylate transporter receptor subunit TctC
MTRVLRFAAVALLVLAQGVFAQGYPNKPLKLIVPFPPGGPTDIVGRLMAQKLSEGLGQQIVVENRAGAGGTVGSDAAAKATADGYTLLYGSTSTLAIAPSLYPNLPYQPLQAFAPISLVSIGPIFVTVHASVPAQTLAEFIALARSKPGQLNYSSAGNGTPPHLAGELFKSVAGVNLVHVPYKGGGPAVAGLVAGDVQAVFEGLPVLGPHIRAGKLRALAITGGKRHPSLPDVPTAAEAGLANYDAHFWSGLVAPFGTPQEAIARLNAETRKALAAKEVRELLARQGVEPRDTTPGEFARFIAAEIDKWAGVVKASGAKLD